MARSVITGATSRASRVMSPSKIRTGIAENAQPLPRDEVITAMMMKSSTDLTARVEKSPVRPSWIAPTMAIAPMQTVREAVTNALTNCRSPSLPVFFFSHSPKRSNPFSIPRSSPMTVPAARQSTTSMDLPLTS